MKKIIWLFTMTIFVMACNKNDDDIITDDYTNRLNFIIEDNQSNFASFSSGMSRTNYKHTLSEEGPYTVMLPDNNAFVAAGYTTPNDVLTESANVLATLIPYHITHGRWTIDKLPFKFNQEFESITGAKMYVTRWIKNADTVVTINGTKVLTYNMEASNGLIQVLNTVLQPLVHNTLSDAIAANNNLTYLNVALQRSGLKPMLEKASETFTVFAPNNAAFVSAGYATIQDIVATDPTVLKKQLEYTLFSGRKFVYDYILTTDATDKTEQKMLSGNNITISLVKSGINYTGITIKGIGNTANGTIVSPNILAGNGVMHVTSQLLKETF